MLQGCYKATGSNSTTSQIYFGHVYSSEDSYLHSACIQNYLAKIKLNYGAGISQLVKQANDCMTYK